MKKNSKRGTRSTSVLFCQYHVFYFYNFSNIYNMSGKKGVSKLSGNTGRLSSIAAYYSMGYGLPLGTGPHKKWRLYFGIGPGYAARAIAQMSAKCACQIAWVCFWLASRWSRRVLIIDPEKDELVLISGIGSAGSPSLALGSVGVGGVDGGGSLL